MKDSSKPRFIINPGSRRFQFDYLYFGEPMHLGSLLLYQIGDLSCDSAFVLSPHQQICYEISYVVSGRGSFGTPEHQVELQPGDIYICKPGEIHQGKADPKDPFRYLYVGFGFNTEQEEYNPWMPIHQMMESKQVSHCRDRFNIHTPFVNALKELSNVTLFSKSMIQMYLEQLLVLTYRNFFTNWEAKYPGDGMNHTTKRVVYSAISYINENLMQIHDIKEVSDAFGYSLSHLSTLFAKETGYTLHNYYITRKWNKASELLREGSYTVTEVATAMQFASIHTFSRAFRKVTGLSPTQYIKEVRSTNSERAGGSASLEDDRKD